MDNIHTVNNNQGSLTPRVISLSELKTRRHPDIIPRPIGIVPVRSGIEPLILRRAHPLDQTFGPTDPRTGNSTPLAGPVSVSYTDGGIASGGPVQLIFWGSVWTQPSTSPSSGQIVSAVQNILSSPYTSALRQYGINNIHFGSSIIVTSPEPPFLPDTFDDGNPNDLVWTLIEEGKFPEPDANGDIWRHPYLYFVIMPPNTQYGPGGARGAHGVASHYDFPFDWDYATVAWIGNNENGNNINRMLSALTHELVEMCTDPFGEDDEYGWTINGLPPPENEIGDICNAEDGQVNGVNVQSYWSQFDNACIIPTSLSVKRTLTFANTISPGSPYTLRSPMPSLKNFLNSL